MVRFNQKLKSPPTSTKDFEKIQEIFKKKYLIYFYDYDTEKYYSIIFNIESSENISVNINGNIVFIEDRTFLETLVKGLLEYLNTI